MATTFQDIATSAAINVFAAFIFLLAFSILRVQPQNARVYFPKWFMNGVRKPSTNDKESKKIRDHISKYVNTDYKAYVKLLNWMWEAIKMPEEELIDHAGLDSAVFLRIFLLGLKIFLPIAAMGFIVLVPINYTDNYLVFQDSQNGTTADLKYSEIDKLSISNVNDKSIRLWAHLLMSYLFTIWICIMLYLEFRTVANMRIRHLITRKRAPDQFTVLVRQVPPVPGKSIQSVVEDFFRHNHPEYLQTEVVYNANKLAALLKKIEALENWLQYSEIKFEKNPSRRPTKKLGFWGLWGQKVDAIDYYTAEIEKLTQQARVEHGNILSDSRLAMPAAFVSFQSRRAAAVCAQTQQTRNTTKWLTDWAPEPRDVYWKNLAIPYLSLTMRNVLMAGLLLVLIFFNFVPIGFISTLADLDSFEQRFPFVKPITQNPRVRAVISGFLPGLGLKIFQAILPTFVMIMAKFEGHLSRSSLDQISAAKLYLFYVINTFFGTVITGSLVAQLQSYINNSSVTTLLQTFGESIPVKGTFFITFIMVDGWAGVSLEIIRIIPLILYHIKNLVLVRTPKDRDRAMAPGSVLLDQSIPRLELYFLFGIVYSIMTPILIPFIIIFFAFGYLAYRNQVINVYDPTYDSAASFWPHVHARIIVAMIIEQLTLIGVFTVKGPIGFVKDDNLSGTRHKALKYLRDILSSTPFMVLLPISTLIFHVYCSRRFHPAFQNYPLEDAAAKDRQEKKDSPNLDLKEYLDKAYENPALKTEEENYLEDRSTHDGNGKDSSTDDIEGGTSHALLEEDEAEEEVPLSTGVRSDGSDAGLRRQNVNDPSDEFLEALSKQPSLEGDESPTSFHDSRSSPLTNRLQ